MSSWLAGWLIYLCLCAKRAAFAGWREGNGWVGSGRENIRGVGSSRVVGRWVWDARWLPSRRWHRVCSNPPDNRETPRLHDPCIFTHPPKPLVLVPEHHGNVFTVISFFVTFVCFRLTTPRLHSVSAVLEDGHLCSSSDGTSSTRRAPKKKQSNDSFGANSDGFRRRVAMSQGGEHCILYRRLLGGGRLGLPYLV